MSQTLKLTGLEEGGLLTSTLLEEYNGMKTNAAKRRLMLDVLRNGYALEKMGLGPVITLLERTDGENFLKLSEQDRLRRLMTMIGALLGETLAVQPPAPAATVATPQPVDIPPAQNASQPTPADLKPEEEDDATQPNSDDEQPLVTRNDEDNSSRRVENVRTANLPAGAMKLRSSSSAKRNNG